MSAALKRLTGENRDLKKAMQRAGKELAGQMESLGAQLAAAREKKAELALKLEIERRDRELEISNSEGDTAELQLNCDRLGEQVKDLEQACNRGKSQIERLQTELTRLKSERKNERASVVQVERELAKVHGGLEKKTMRMQSDVSLLEKRLRASLDSTRVAVTEVHRLKNVVRQIVEIVLDTRVSMDAECYAGLPATAVAAATAVRKSRGPSDMLVYTLSHRATPEWLDMVAIPPSSSSKTSLEDLDLQQDRSNPAAVEIIMAFTEGVSTIHGVLSRAWQAEVESKAEVERALVVEKSRSSTIERQVTTMEKHMQALVAAKRDDEARSNERNKKTEAAALARLELDGSKARRVVSVLSHILEENNFRMAESEIREASLLYTSASRSNSHRQTGSPIAERRSRDRFTSKASTKVGSTSVELTGDGRANEDERDGENVQLPNLLRIVLENTRELLRLRGQNEQLQTSLNESKLENLSRSKTLIGAQGSKRLAMHAAQEVSMKAEHARAQIALMESEFRMLAQVLTIRKQGGAQSKSPNKSRSQAFKEDGTVDFISIRKMIETRLAAYDKLVLQHESLRQDYVKSKNAEQEVRVSQRASKQERERLQTSLEEARASERRLLGQVDTLAEEGDRWRREHETTHGELRKTQTRLQALGDTMGRLRDMLAESQQNAVAVRKMRDEIQRLGGDLGASQRTLHALQVDRERMQALFRTASEEVQSLERELDAARSANVTAAKAIEDVIRSTRGEQAGAKMITSKLELVERHVGFCFFVFLFFVCPFLI